MKCSLFNSPDPREVVELFTDVFSTAAGQVEGLSIGTLVYDLFMGTSAEDLIVCVAVEADQIIGSAIFSRFTVPDDHTAFILSPLAVSTGKQRSGVGQQLIRFGLEHLKALEVSFVFVYGDPAYYSKSGFEIVDIRNLQAPYPLSHPFGWQALSLNNRPVQLLQGETGCVAAMRNINYW